MARCDLKNEKEINLSIIYPELCYVLKPLLGDYQFTRKYCQRDDNYIRSGRYLYTWMLLKISETFPPRITQSLDHFIIVSGDEYRLSIKLKFLSE